MPWLGGETKWLDSEPLGPAERRGHVVLVDFCTLTCINWLRTEPYIHAWSQAYRNNGLVVIGVHTPEFSSEHQIGRVRRATKERGIDDPSRSTTTTQFGAPSTPLLAGAVLRRHRRHHP
jgi:thiol-disulfide isomerase/thioredoxin